MRKKPPIPRTDVPATRAAGDAAEQAAADFLEAQGLHLVARNYRCLRGELDLIAEQGEALVFVEVRLRSRGDFGGGLASVDWRKQQRLIAAAQHFLQQHPRMADRPCRFDVIALGPGRDTAPAWIRNAFDAG